MGGRLFVGHPLVDSLTMLDCDCGDPRLEELARLVVGRLVVFALEAAPFLDDRLDLPIHLDPTAVTVPV